MKKFTVLLLFVLLGSFAASASPLLATGVFAASGTNVWAAPQLTFTATSFAVPTTAGSFNVNLGSIKTPALSGSIAGGGVTPDFTLSFNSFGDTTMVGPILTFGFNISGFLNGFGGGGYDVFPVTGDAVAVRHILYTDDHGSGSFDIRLRGISNVNSPGFLSVGPTNACQNNPGCFLGATITNAAYAVTITESPEPGTLILFGTGLGLVFANRLSKSLKYRKARKSV